MKRTYGFRASHSGLIGQVSLNCTFVGPRGEHHSTAGKPSMHRYSHAIVAPPNGCSKLIIPCENSLVSVGGGEVQISHEQRLYFVGNRDSSTLIQSSSRKTSFIAIEFCPHGAFPIFGIPMAETFNGLWDFDVLFARWSRGVREVLNNLQRVDQKVAFIQDQLIVLLRKNDCRSSLVEYCVQSLKSADGRLPFRNWSNKPVTLGAIWICSLDSTLAFPRRCWPESFAFRSSIENGRRGNLSTC
jgi:hypothetical protein